MSKKAAEAPKEKVILGRFGSNLSMGIVGLPNVGKSTFFNVLTKSQVPAENFPFCTIDPNTARVPVPDDRFDWLVSHYKPASAVPAHLTITDIAGLVKGAAEGEGLGNAFLSHIRAVDGIYHMIRVFDDADIIHVEGALDPVRDLEIIATELLAKDLEFVTKHHAGLEATLKRVKDKNKQIELEICAKVIEFLKTGKEIRMGDWKAAEIEVLNTLQLITAKPAIYLVNMTPNDFINKKNKYLGKIKKWIDDRTGEELIPVSAAFELKLLELEDAADRAKYCEEVKAQSILPKVTKSGYHGLGLCHYFTAGEDEVKAWTIKNGTKAPQAAGKIHTDFEKNFICADCLKFTDLKEIGSESLAKAQGKVRQEGKNYVVQDADILLFKFGRSG